MSASSGSNPRRNRRVRRAGAMNNVYGLGNGAPSGMNGGPRRLLSIGAGAWQFVHGAGPNHAHHPQQGGTHTTAVALNSSQYAAASAPAVVASQHKKAQKRRSNEDPVYVPPGSGGAVEAMQIDPASDPAALPPPGVRAGIGAPLGGSGGVGSGLRLPKRNRTLGGNDPEDERVAAAMGGLHHTDVQVLDERRRAALLLRQHYLRQWYW